MAFRNPDGSTVLVAYNPSEEAVPFTVRTDGKAFAYTLQPNTAVTFLWGGKTAAPAQ